MAERYVVQMSKEGGAPYQVLDKTSRQMVSAEVTAREAAIAAEAAAREAADTAEAGLRAAAVAAVHGFIRETGYVLKSSLVESGKWDCSRKLVDSTYLRSKNLIPVLAGMTVVFSNPSLKMYFGVMSSLESTTYEQLTLFGNTGKKNIQFKIEYDGYLVINMTKNETITVADYDTDLIIKSGLNHEIESDHAIVTTRFKANEWAEGSINPTNGTIQDSATANTQIRTFNAVGVINNIYRIVAETGILFYVMAWDLNGVFKGHFNGNNEFSTQNSNFKLRSQFDCTAFPDYVFRIVAQNPSLSATMTPEDGNKVHFCGMDDTMKMANVPAEAQAVGYREVIYKITSSDIESGRWIGGSKAETTHFLRNKRLIPVRKDMDVFYKSPTHKVIVGVTDSINITEYSYGTGWVDPSDLTLVYHVPIDGYLMIDVRDDNNELTVSDYDCDITIYDNLLYEEATQTGNDDLFKIFKRVGVIGDSLSVGYIRAVAEETGATRNLPYSWVKACGQDADVFWLNFGHSGFTTLTWCSDPTYGKVQMEAENNKCQAYIIGIGQNDEYYAGNTVPLGSESDIVDNPDTVATTFYGGYNRIIQLIKRRNANAKIFCLTCPRATESAGYNNAVRYIATEHYDTDDNVFLVELAGKWKRNFTAMGFGIVENLSSDNTHYSATGYRLIAKVIEKAIGEVIRANQSHFDDLPLDPYDTGTPTANTMTE